VGVAGRCGRHHVAGNTGGTGCCSTSLKNSGRSPEIGISEVHQALALNGLRDKVILRCSGAHQSGLDVVKSAILGADSFEFGTTALMMLRCVMAKNCNIKCPAGLTTSHEEFKGDPRVLAQYFMNLAHEVREILAVLGYQSLLEIRGKTDLLHLIDHPTMIGQLDLTKLLAQVDSKIENLSIWKPTLVSITESWNRLKPELLTASSGKSSSKVRTLAQRCNKTVGGRLPLLLSDAFLPIERAASCKV
jgi:glutamate synthase (NADPH/NADH) large chain